MKINQLLNRISLFLPIRLLHWAFFFTFILYHHYRLRSRIMNHWEFSSLIRQHHSRCLFCIHHLLNLLLLADLVFSSTPYHLLDIFSFNSSESIFLLIFFRLLITCLLLFLLLCSLCLGLSLFLLMKYLHELVLIEISEVIIVSIVRYFLFNHWPS
jgi:hypothetical protein